MAFPTVEAIAETTIATNQSAPAIALPAPAGGILADDLVLILLTGDSSSYDVTDWGGFTEIGRVICGTSAQQALHAVAMKRMAGGETGDVTLTTFAEHGTAQALCIRGAHTVSAPELSSNNNSGNAPDPPSLTPTWGADDTLWIASLGHDSTITVTSGPANYTNLDHLDADGTSGAGTAHARRELNAASEDPGAFAFPANEQWGVFTIAIRPAGAGAGTTHQTAAWQSGYAVDGHQQAAWQSGYGVAAGPTHVTAAWQSGYVVRERAYTADSPWNELLAALYPAGVPVAANSYDVLKFLSDEQVSKSDLTPTGGVDRSLNTTSSQFTIPAYDVYEPAAASVVFDGTLSFVSDDATSTTNTSGGGTQANVPIPASFTYPDGTVAALKPSPGTDGEIAILDWVNRRKWFFFSCPTNADGTWQTDVNGAYQCHNLSSVPMDFDGVPPATPDTYSSRGSATPYDAGLLRRWELEQAIADQSTLGHALAATVQSTSTQFVSPAQTSDGALDGPNMPPMGSRIKLRADFPIDDTVDRDGTNAEAVRAVLRTLRDHGMVLIDNAGAPKLYVEDDLTAGWDRVFSTTSFPADLLYDVPFDAESFVFVDPAGTSLLRDQRAPSTGVTPAAVERVTGVHDNGGLAMTGSFATDTALTPAAGDKLVLVASLRGNQSANLTAVTGNGATWTLVRRYTDPQAVIGYEVWEADTPASPTADPVTVTVNGAGNTEALALRASRYPAGTVVRKVQTSADPNLDQASPRGNLRGVLAGSLVEVHMAHRLRDVTAAAGGLTQIGTTVIAGTGGAQARLSSFDMTAATAGDVVDVGADLSSTDEWAFAALELATAPSGTQHVTAGWASGYEVVDHRAAAWTSGYAVSSRVTVGWQSGYHAGPQLYPSPTLLPSSSLLPGGTPSAAVTASWRTTYAVAGGSTHQTAGWQSRYQVARRVTAGWASGYRVAQRQAAGWTSTFQVIERLAAAWASAYAAGGRRAAAWTSSYQVAERVAVGWHSSATVAARVQASWASSATVAARVASAWTSSATVRARVAEAWTSGYEVADRRAAAWASSYRVAGRVTIGWRSDYRVAERVLVAWATSYTVAFGGVVLRTGRDLSGAIAVETVRGAAEPVHAVGAIGPSTTPTGAADPIVTPTGAADPTHMTGADDPAVTPTGADDPAHTTGSIEPAYTTGGSEVSI